MEMWPHAPLSLDSAQGCGNSATSGAIPRKNSPSGPVCTATTSVESSAANGMSPWRTLSSWQKHFLSRPAIYSVSFLDSLVLIHGILLAEAIQQSHKSITYRYSRQYRYSFRPQLNHFASDDSGKCAIIKQHHAFRISSNGVVCDDI